MPTSPLLPLKIRTSLLYLSLTDALGAPLEFGPRISNPASHITTMLPNYNFNLPPGHFTDDTSMTLCLARSLLDNNGSFSSVSQAKLYLAWYQTGYMSSVPGHCFDIGNQTRTTLSVWNRAIESHGDDLDPELTLSDIKANFSRDKHCGNGSLMRVLPCALVSTSLPQAVSLARQSSTITHPHPRCLDACALYTTLVFAALHSATSLTKQDLISQHLRPFLSSSSSQEIDTTLVARFTRYTSLESFTSTPISSVKSTGYVLDTLEAALWAFFTTDSYAEGAIRVVNLGDDADTVGAVYGGLAGAWYAGRSDASDVDGDGGRVREWTSAMQKRSLQMVEEMAGEVVRVFHS